MQSCSQYVIKDKEKRNSRQGMSKQFNLDKGSQHFNKFPWN